jgi:hypothetical protein
MRPPPSLLLPPSHPPLSLPPLLPLLLRSAKEGLEWWQVDVSYGVLRCLEKLGLVWNIKQPSPVQVVSQALGRVAFEWARCHAACRL